MLPFVLINIKETVFNLSGKSQNIDTEFISQMFNVFHFYFDTCNLHVATKAWLTFSWLCFGTQSTKIRERLYPQSLKAHRTQYDECRMWTRVSVLCFVQTTQVNSILLQCNEENKTLLAFTNTVRQSCMILTDLDFRLSHLTQPYLSFLLNIS